MNQQEKKLAWHFVSDSLPEKSGAFLVTLKRNPGRQYPSWWNGYRWKQGEDVVMWASEITQGELPLV